MESLLETHIVKAVVLPAVCLFDMFQHQHFTLSLGYFVQWNEGVVRGEGGGAAHWSSHEWWDCPMLHHTACPEANRDTVSWTCWHRKGKVVRCRNETVTDIMIYHRQIPDG